MTEYRDRDKKADELGKRIAQMLKDELGEGDPYLLYRRTLGRVMAETCFHHTNDFSENFITWSVNHALSLRIEPIIERALALHSWLVEKGHNDENVWDLNHCDRYACYLANEPDFRAFAAQNQNYTWFVAMKKCKSFADFDDGDIKQVEKWSINIRQAVANRSSSNGWRRDLDDFNFLKTENHARGHESLRYLDIRDAGYLLSAKPCIIAGDYEVEGSLSNWPRLGHVVYDLASLCDSAGEDE